MADLTKYSLAELPQVRVLGRTTKERNPLTLFWAASGIEFLFTGSELCVEFEADFDVYEPWVSVELNGAWIARMPLGKGANCVTIFRNMTPGRENHVRILKDVQANVGQIVQITALYGADGEFLPLPEPKLRLEFIGDSITSGEGAIGATCENDWISTFFSAENTYARMTADMLDAEYRTFSHSGWGVVTSWDNNPHHALPLYYNEICSTVECDKYIALGAREAYDFAVWKPDVVVINLGTNDGGAFDNPEWKDESTGEMFKMRYNADGTRNANDLEKVRHGVTAFLEQIREKNPQALLVWVYGMIGNPMEETLRAGVDDYVKKSGDTRTFYLPLPDTKPGEFGARSHPGIASHHNAAVVISEFLRRNI